jgi:hypothetical protein
MMNLNELDALIATFDPKEDREIIDFYLKKRQELIQKIFENVAKRLTNNESYGIIRQIKKEK